ncbi:hypothetical protein A3A84_02390 [Candidatus Collierbacteria bacterium RIFCSPLOWO2_01_FULL_50_23]|uniref:Shikimate kinase n=1 Tax=Candidatus Collierbacteria bacterium RIFCSPHIGHO2_01_FULL_50_25 TaxID=1817722 RepID=A0A1F5EY35_9BACT|nr:MAG: hypothetical protein A2703_02810 [Candidatus Collierbacteria bacterium RIFCSPHIGHO2_01_FULL_50_25]OGD73807.1 MAG: hypothetical protein A3A84_02390 [Candidatus Collierbacteria bacterium RIFCSPLOWO2_01_FULL_50_23]
MKLIIFCGTPFSGKTVLSKKLSERFGFVRIDLDEVKSEMLGDVADEVVTQAQWDNVYGEMHGRIEDYLREGKNVIQDAGNFTEYERDLVVKIGEKFGADIAIICVNILPEVAKARWLENKNSVARVDVGEEYIRDSQSRFEPPHGSNVLVVDGNLTVQEQLKQIHDKFLK